MLTYSSPHPTLFPIASVAGQPRCKQGGEGTPAGEYQGLAYHQVLHAGAGSWVVRGL